MKIMTGRFANSAFIYAVLAMVSGVFYREFTKLNFYDGNTALSVMHTHYFILGMVFFLVLMLIEKNFGISAQSKTGLFVITYQVGLNITVLSFLIRGITQVCQTDISNRMDAFISGIAGTGHIVMSVSMLLLLWRVKKAVKE